MGFDFDLLLFLQQFDGVHLLLDLNQSLFLQLRLQGLNDRARSRVLLGWRRGRDQSLQLVHILVHKLVYQRSRSCIEVLVLALIAIALRSRHPYRG